MIDFIGLSKKRIQETRILHSCSEGIRWESAGPRVHVAVYKRKHTHEREHVHVHARPCRHRVEGGWGEGGQLIDRSVKIEKEKVERASDVD